jgi:hypothetical protein
MKAMSRLDHQQYQNLQVGNIVSNGFDLVTSTRDNELISIHLCHSTQFMSLVEQIVTH